MRRLARTLSVTGLLTLAPVPAALAADPPGVTVDPASAAPGSEVRLTVTGCEGRTGAARSEAFVADGSLGARDGQGPALAGAAMIRSTVTPGTYAVAVTCDGQDGKVKGSFTVVPAQPSPSASPSASPSLSPSPTAPIRAGGGGTASLAGRSDEGPGARHAVVGAVLATAAALAVTGRTVRRRRRSR